MIAHLRGEQACVICPEDALHTLHCKRAFNTATTDDAEPAATATVAVQSTSDQYFQSLEVLIVVLYDSYAVSSDHRGTASLS